MDTFVDFKKMDVGFDDKTSEFLNWALRNRDNLESVKRNEVMEIWQEKNVEGNATLNFNRNGVLLRVKKEIFS